MRPTWPFDSKATLIALILSLTVIYLHARSAEERVPKALSLSSFPREIGDWKGRDLQLDGEVRSTLGSGEFLPRIYSVRAKPPVELFLAYFPTQRTGGAIHSPKNCLPSSGWFPISASQLQFAIPGASLPITANRYLLEKGPDRILVIYWYQGHGRTVANEYWAKYYLVRDAIAINRTDGALVRILTKVEEGEPIDAAQDRIVGFARQITPLLKDFIPD